VQFVRELAVRKARQWTIELMPSYRYVGALKSSFSEALVNWRELTLEEKTKIWNFIEEFLNPNKTEKSVTRIS